MSVVIKASGPCRRVRRDPAYVLFAARVQGDPAYVLFAAGSGGTRPTSCLPPGSKGTRPTSCLPPGPGGPGLRPVCRRVQGDPAYVAPALRRSSQNS